MPSGCTTGPDALPEASKADRGRHVHLVGVGGAGMSTLAELMAAAGFRVSGCDAQESEVLEHLRRIGVDARAGHDPAHLEGASELVVSTAVAPEHPEQQEARRRGIPVTHRARALARLVQGRRLVAVTGAHGKTTVSALVVRVLAAAGLDPLGAVGFALSGHPTGARPGAGPWAVVEADESDSSFLEFRPEVAVVTNIEPDHLEHYGGSFDRLVEAYRRFLGRVSPQGAWVLGADSPSLQQAAAHAAREGGAPATVVFYGLQADADWTASDIRLHLRGASFVAVERGRPVVEVRLGIPGRHNVANALAGLAVARLLGIPPQVAAEAMAGFSGARRRFEVLADWGGVMVVDDYAHHPTEIAATIRAAREGFGRQVVAIFQPHRYSRTAFLQEAFASAFDDADRLILTEIYAPAPEQPLPGISGELLARHVAARPAWAGRPADLAFCPTLAEAEHQALQWAEPGTILLVMGAGDVTRLAHRLARALTGRQRPAPPPLAPG